LQSEVANIGNPNTHNQVQSGVWAGIANFATRGKR
jgi:hypothetical protein